ncbi:RING finger 151-like isoform X2 [Paramuricea clavata]|uniref:RING finger 151-like isoform X2 n=1 Tax=Paramuricea clavata TaxID=317549 RepID=A0A6S7HWP3_PARCT|nr:RING finger 151-like isoform X2 [Paramuricea clavata]
MASYIQGYDEERFASTVNRNFLCLICFNVLKDHPVLCPRNQHCFCRGCITKHLENSRRCPTCADELTVETLAEPNRMVKDYLNELNIHCVYNNRGCQEIRDLIHHQSELCEFRKLKCHSCGEMTKTLADMEKRMVATNLTMETKVANLEKNMDRKFEAVNNEVRGLKTALIEGFDEMKDVLVKMEDKKKKTQEK